MYLVLRDASVISVHGVVHHATFAHASAVEGPFVLVLFKLLLLRRHDASADHAQGR